MNAHYSGSSARSFEKRVAKLLGVTPAGLGCLVLAVAKGRAEGQGFVRFQGARDRLFRQGYIAVDDDKVIRITEAGREIVKRARALGF